MSESSAGSTGSVTAEPTGPRVAEALRARASAIAERVTGQQFSADPTLFQRFGERGVRKCTEDSLRHLSYLASAAAVSSDSLFADYVAWAKVLLARLGMSEQDLAQNLLLLRDAVRGALDDELGDEAVRIVDVALEDLERMPSRTESYLSGGQPLEDLARGYLEALLSGDRRAATQLILDAVEEGASVADVYLHVLQPTQYEIGRRWQLNQLTVAEEHYCTAAAQLTMSMLYPRIFATNRVGRRMVAACVGGDLHEIGARMVADFFEMAGWDTYYLGANTPLPSIVDAVAAQRADVLAISATMTYHVPAVAEVVRAVRDRLVEHAPLILVGGYPFLVDSGLWKRIGADGFAADAPSAVHVAKRYVEGRPGV